MPLFNPSKSFEECVSRKTASGMPKEFAQRVCRTNFPDKDKEEAGLVEGLLSGELSLADFDEAKVKRDKGQFASKSGSDSDSDSDSEPKKAAGKTAANAKSTGTFLMYRGSGEGSDVDTGFEWFSETPKLASRYAAHRDGTVQKSNVTVKSPIEIANGKQVVSASSFTTNAIKQTSKDKRGPEKQKMLAARQEFITHFGKSEQRMDVYWSSPKAKEATKKFLEAFGFDSIVMEEQGERTVATLRKASSTKLSLAD